MIVWRLQHPETGEGPYQPQTDLAADLCYAHTWQTHPPPGCDGLEFVSAFEVCGMPTKASLLEWFKGFEDRLAKAGYEILKVRAPRGSYRKGYRQIVYKPSRAVVLSRSPIKAQRGSTT